MQKYFLALVACCSLSAPLKADPLPTFAATSGDFTFLYFGAGSNSLQTEVDLTGSNFTLRGGAGRQPAGPIEAIPGTGFSVSLATPTGLYPQVQLAYGGSLELDGVTYSVRYSGSATVTPTESIVVPTSGPSATIPAVLSGTYVACIGEQTFPDPCSGPGIQDIANVTAVNIPGVLTYDFSLPNSAGINILDRAVFTSIPEPSTLLLLLAGFAMCGAVPESYCTMRRCLRRNAGVS
ncbi:MAG: PEP-CTERM sorting domain-containing protein [Acidobacteriaceae bacterium]|nr:PEP-CTERM sorting domain-containing protein [Acidobacteriaceae bacterium]